MVFLRPKVSVIIPTYNRPNLIKRAIKSILNQTYQNFEIIIIDDSPNDETEKVIKNFHDERIKYIRNQKRKGPSAARNQGIKESSKDSKYIAFLDDDDEYLPHFLEKTIKKLEEDKELVMVATDCEIRDRKGNFIRRGRWNFNKYFWKQAMGNGSVVRRNLFFKENIWYDEKLVLLLEDIGLSLRALRNRKWGFVPEILRIYYHYPSQKGKNLSTYAVYDQQWLLKDIDYFLRKNLAIYKKIGNHAVGWLYFYIGKYCCRVGLVKKGREFLLKSFTLKLSLITLFYNKFIFSKVVSISFLSYFKT